MKVNIAVGGRFHAFDLAAQLQKREVLGSLITSYPKFKTKEWGLRGENVKSILSHELLNRAWHKFSRYLPWNNFDPAFWLHDRFDRKASKQISEDGDVFVGWSGMSLRSLRQAKRFGSVAIVERGSSHIVFNRDLMREEYTCFGQVPLTADERIVERELEEYSEADFISIPSSFVRRTFLQHGIPENKLVQVPYGVDLGSFHAGPKEDNVFRVIHCGTISLRKGVHYLLQAFSELDLKNAELMLIGPRTREIEPFLRRYDRPNLRLVGAFPQARLRVLYSQGSVFCLASVEEGLAMVIPQAMACGLPVLCTANTGGGDIVRNGVDGFVIPICDVEALKEKITFLYEHRDICREMGRSACESVQTGFTWDDYGEKMVGHYRRVLDERRGGSGGVFGAHT